MSLTAQMPIRRGFTLLISLALALGAMVPFVSPAPARAAATDLFFSEYVEGDGNNKALEIYNGTGIDVDLGLHGYAIRMYFNGSTSFTPFNLSGTLAAGDVLVVVNNGALNEDLRARADVFDPRSWFNGNDVVALAKGGTIIDAVGQVGLPAPDVEWGSGLTSTADNTLRRKPCVTEGDADLTDPFDPAAEWDGFARNTFDGLGTHVLSGQPCVLPVTDPTGSGTATPASVMPGSATSLSVQVIGGENPASTGLTVIADLSQIGGSAAQAFAQSPTANVFTFEATVAIGTAPDAYVLPVTITDEQGRRGQTTIALTVEGDPTEIWEIQGTGHLSPMDGDLVSGVEGVVTAVRADSRGRSGGFWMEDPTPDADPHTSDAIFVFTRSTPAVTVGDLVSVAGRVDEFRPFFEDLTITEIVDPSWTIVSSGNPLPMVSIGVDRMPPSTVIDDDSSGSVEDADSVYDPANDGIDFWETMEGMRLSVADAVAVGARNNFGEIAVISQLQADAGLRTPRGGLLVRNLTGGGDYQPGDFNPERLLLDDLLARTPMVNVGDGFTTDPVGVLDQSFGAFKLLVTAESGRVDNGLQRETAAPTGPRELAVATFNVENLAATDSDAKVNALASQIVNNLRSPDLIAIEEMRDNNGNTNDGTVAADLSWQRLIDAIVLAGGPVYDYRQIDPLNNTDGGVPGGNIRVGFLFHSERGLEFVDRPGGDAVTDTDVVATPDGKGARLTISPGRVLDAALGGDKAFLDTRKSLAGEFRFRGETVFVVANHFSSKGDDRPLYSQYQPPFRLTEFESGDTEDGWRHAQAQAINDFVDEILIVDPDAHVIVLGDINDFDFSETVGVLTGELQAVSGGPDPDGSGPTIAGSGPVLGTLFDLLPESERYSYVFEGNSQVLDQILVSSSLLALAPTYDVVHVNAEFADQASDHDPSVMRVAFQPRAADPVVTDAEGSPRPGGARH